MYDLFEEKNLRQPLTFHVRAALAWRSVAQLRWLMEMTGATLTVYAFSEDGVTLQNLMYIRQKLPKDEVFYDIPQEMEQLLDGLRGGNEETIEIQPLMGEKDKGHVFKAEEWIILRADHGEKVYLGTESLMLQRGILLSRDKYDVSRMKSMMVHGRVEFVEKTKSASTSDLGLEIVLSVVQGARPGAISGFKCFIGSLGHISIATQSIPGADTREDGTMFESPQTIGCAHFTIEHTHQDKIKFTINQVKDCASSVSDILNTASVTLPVKDISMDAGHIAVRGTGDNGFAAIPMLKVEHEKL